LWTCPKLSQVMECKCCRNRLAIFVVRGVGGRVVLARRLLRRA
jgi:hypothetical protein